MLTRPSKQFRSRLVRMAARVSGARHIPATLPALLEMIHTGSLVVDDIQDNSGQRRGAACLHRLHGIPVALNTATGCTSGLTLLETLGLPDAVAAELRQRMCAAMFRCHFGQALDLSLPVGPAGPAAGASGGGQRHAPEDRSADRAGRRDGRAGGGRRRRRWWRHSGVFGRRLGVGLQMLDDLSNITEGTAEGDEEKLHEDLRLGRPTWPWAWAAADLDQQKFAQLQLEGRVLNARALAGGPADASPLAGRLRAAI